MFRQTATALALCLSVPIESGAQEVDEAAELDAAFGIDEEAGIEVVGRDDGQRVARLAAGLRPSLAVITLGGRAGGEAGTGTGFVVSEDGLIATCAHVIGEARPLTVRLGDDTEHEVTAVHAWDASLDLAVLRIDARGLAPIPLAAAEELEQGAEVVTIGSPHGYDYSVVGGFVSALRAVDARELVQVAMPIEPGNSGGPLLDMDGRAHGLITMKSSVTDNLGFAVPIEGLHKLLEKPNTVPMEKWLTIGKLNPKRWTPLMGARWSQRAGRITASGAGAGFGGRSLCLSEREVPETPYEVAVEVLLDNESGAAGLVFAADGEDRHYAFYPSLGRLRLTRFDGPDVTSWNILEQIETPAYRPGEWNRLRVRVGEETITAWVNGEQILQRDDAAFRGGRAGLAKFRGTEPTFRRFRTGTDLAPEIVAPEFLANIEEQIDKMALAPERAAAMEKLLTSPEISRGLLAERARKMREAAAELEASAAVVHQRSVAAEIVAALDKGGEGSLLRAALLLGKLDNPELDIEIYIEEVERMAGEISAAIEDGAGDGRKAQAVRNYLFTENGYHGSRSDRYHRANSYLNEVIDDREGTPTTLTLLFVELARRAGIDMHGLGLPGHFVAFYEQKGVRILLDPFDGGAPLSEEDAQALIEAAGIVGTPADFPPAEPRGTIQRLLKNLKAIAIEEKDFPGAIRYVDVLLGLDPEDGQERLSRALLHVQNEDGEAAKPDLEWLFEHQPEGVQIDRLRELYDRL